MGNLRESLTWRVSFCLAKKQQTKDLVMKKKHGAECVNIQIKSLKVLSKLGIGRIKVPQGTEREKSENFDSNLSNEIFDPIKRG